MSKKITKKTKDHRKKAKNLVQTYSSTLLLGLLKAKMGCANDIREFRILFSLFKKMKLDVKCLSLTLINFGVRQNFMLLSLMCLSFHACAIFN